MPNEGLFPSVQRAVRTGVGYAGDTAGNLVNTNGKAIQDAAYAAGRRVDDAARSLSQGLEQKPPIKKTGVAGAKPAGKTSKTAGTAPVKGAERGVQGRQVVQGYAGYAGRQVGAVGRYVDGSGRAAGGRVGDFGNRVKDVSGARGKRMSTPANPLGLNKPHV